MARELKAHYKMGALLAFCLISSPIFAQSSQGDDSAAQTQMSSADKAVADRVYAALNQDQKSYYRHVTVTASNGVVTLGGFVNGAESQARAKKIAAGVPGVSKVTDHTQLQPEGEQ